MLKPFGSALSLTILTGVLASLTICAQAQQILFSENFDGHFSQVWSGTPGMFPDQSLSPFRPQTVVQIGAPTTDFTTVDGASVLRMHTSQAANWSRYGLLSQASVPITNGQVEARINTLDQGGLNIDGLFELWLINSHDPSKFVNVGLFGDSSDTRRSWYYSTSR